MSIQNAAQAITISVDGKQYQGWVAQTSKSRWRATCTFENRYLEGSGSSRGAAIEALQWQANNHDS